MLPYIYTIHGSYGYIINREAKDRPSKIGKKLVSPSSGNDFGLTNDMILDIQYVVDPLLGKYIIISFRGKNFMETSGQLSSYDFLLGLGSFFTGQNIGNATTKGLQFRLSLNR